MLRTEDIHPIHDADRPVDIENGYSADCDLCGVPFEEHYPFLVSDPFDLDHHGWRYFGDGTVWCSTCIWTNFHDELPAA